MNRQKVKRHFYIRLIIASAFVGGLASILALLLKTITIFCQDFLYEKALEKNFLFVIFPTIGITGIYFLRKYFFKNRKNKGITEIYKTVDQRKDHLPLFKIPSHIINWFFDCNFWWFHGCRSFCCGGECNNREQHLSIFFTKSL